MGKKIADYRRVSRRNEEIYVKRKVDCTDRQNMNDLGKGYDRVGKYKFRIDLSNEKSKSCSAL